MNSKKPELVWDCRLTKLQFRWFQEFLRSHPRHKEQSMDYIRGWFEGHSIDPYPTDLLVDYVLRGFRWRRGKFQDSINMFIDVYSVWGSS